MTYYIKQKITFFRDKFAVYDADEKPCFYAEGEVFSWTHKLHLTDTDGQELALLHRKPFSWLPHYYIEQTGKPAVDIVRRLSFRPRFYLNTPAWTVVGNFTEHDFTVNDENEQPIATVHKKWMSWADCYSIDIADGVDETLVLCTVLAVDCILADAAAAKSSN